MSTFTFNKLGKDRVSVARCNVINANMNLPQWFFYPRIENNLKKVLNISDPEKADKYVDEVCKNFIDNYESSFPGRLDELAKGILGLLKENEYLYEFIEKIGAGLSLHYGDATFMVFVCYKLLMMGELCMCEVTNYIYERKMQ